MGEGGAVLTDDPVIEKYYFLFVIGEEIAGVILVAIIHAENDLDWKLGSSHMVMIISTYIPILAIT